MVTLEPARNQRRFARAGQQQRGAMTAAAGCDDGSSSNTAKCTHLGRPHAELVKQESQLWRQPACVDDGDLHIIQSFISNIQIFIRRVLIRWLAQFF